MSSLRRLLEPMLLAVVVALTLTTAYIHFWVGGVLLLLNATGYVGLAAALVGSAFAFRRALPLVLIALAGYAATTIVGWLIMGPYFDVAYIAKGVEIALIVTISITLRRLSTETRSAISWALSFVGRFASIRRGRPATLPATGAADE